MQLKLDLKFYDRGFRNFVVAMAAAAADDVARQTAVAIAIEAAKVAADVTPYVTGSLAASHMVEDAGNPVYVVIDPSAVNPFSDENPPEYGPKVHSMGGVSKSGHPRAFYDNVVENYSEELLDYGEEFVVAKIGVFGS